MYSIVKWFKTMKAYSWSNSKYPKTLCTLWFSTEGERSVLDGVQSHPYHPVATPLGSRHPGPFCHSKPKLKANPIIRFFGKKSGPHKSFSGNWLCCKLSLNGHTRARAHARTLSVVGAAAACAIMRQSLEGLIWTALYRLRGNSPLL